MRLKAEVIKVIDSRTAKVQLVRMVLHPKYQKWVKKRSTKLVHVGNNREVKAGDKVTLRQIAKVSKLKSWMVVSS